MAATAAVEGAAGAADVAGVLSAGDFCAHTGDRLVVTKAASVTTAAIATEEMLRRAAQRWWLSIRGTHCHKQPIIGMTTPLELRLKRNLQSVLSAQNTHAKLERFQSRLYELTQHQ